MKLPHHAQSPLVSGVHLHRLFHLRSVTKWPQITDTPPPYNLPRPLAIRH